MKWSDLLRVKAEFPINLWPNAAQAYHHWIRAAIRENKPYDRFVRELLTESGSNFRDAPVNFYRAMQSKEPPAIAQTVALTFMGTRAEKWPKERLAAMAGFFSQIGYKETAEWKEEIVYFKPARRAPPSRRLPRWHGRPTRPRPRSARGLRRLADHAQESLVRAQHRQPRLVLAARPRHHPGAGRHPPRQSARRIPNCWRIWNRNWSLPLRSQAHLSADPEFQTYQLSSIPRSDRPEAAANFASYPLRRLDAEVLIDAICETTGTTETYSSAIPEPYTYIPEDQRSIGLPDGSITSSFLELFGRPPRDTGLESERNNRPTAAQHLHMLNSSHVQRKIEQSPKFQYLIHNSKTGRRLSPRCT